VEALKIAPMPALVTQSVIAHEHVPREQLRQASVAERERGMARGERRGGHGCDVEARAARVEIDLAPNPFEGAEADRLEPQDDGPVLAPLDAFHRERNTVDTPSVAAKRTSSVATRGFDIDA
jgi:hypothetical protein